MLAVLLETMVLERAVVVVVRRIEGASDDLAGRPTGRVCNMNSIVPVLYRLSKWSCVPQ